MQMPAVDSGRYANRWVGLIFICISLVVIALDNTILNVALPAISNTLGATATDLQWIVDSYVLVFAALLLTTGSFSDRIGRKKALQVGLVLFGVGSLAAALSTSTVMLIASRAFLGLAGAMIMPATLSLVSASFPPVERGQAIGIWVAVFGFGVGLGPVIGGFLIQNFSWNAVFYVNLPVVVVALIGGAIFLRESKDESAPKADIPGVILSIIGLFALVYGIIEAGLHGWAGANVIAAFVVAFVFLGAFAWWESRAANAMLPMHFFRNRAFTGANIMLTMFSFSLFGSMYFMSQYFQTVQHVPAFEAGLRVLPHAITMTFMSTRANKIAARLGHKRTIALGTIIAAAGMFYMSRMFHVDTPYILIAVGQVILAIGLGTAFSPATTAVMNSVPASKAGIGSAMNDTTRQLGGALGVAVLGTIATNTYLNGIAPLRETLASAAPEAAQVVSNSIQAAHQVAREMPLPSSLSETIITTTSEAFVNGMNTAMLISSVTMLLAFFLVLVVLPSRVRSVEMYSEDVVEPSQKAAVLVPSGD